MRGRLPNVREERGAVLIIVAAALFGLVFIAAFVIDTANWFEHKRHLQLQVDAAALAGADSISLPLSSCNNAGIDAAAHNYGGRDATNPNAQYNSQVGNSPSSNIHILINSSSYWSAGDPTAVDNSGGAPCDTVNNSFCPNSVGVDVKGTEAGLPWFFGGGVLKVPKINAHARVCLMQETSSSNALPIAVPNPRPKSVAAILINYANSNSVVGAIPLSECQNPAPPASPTCPSSVDLWTSLGTDEPIVAQTGVVIAISGLTSIPTSGLTLAQICSQPLTDCFDASKSPPPTGVTFIRGWSGSSGIQPSPPNLSEVQLFPGNCPGNAYFQLIAAGCNLTLEAVVASRLSDGTDARTNINVSGAGCGAHGCDLSKDINVPQSPECTAVKANGAVGTCWRGSIPISAYAGAQQLTMNWTVSQGSITGSGDCTRGSGCKGTFDGGGAVQQAYTGDNRPSSNISGPLARVQILGCTTSTNCPTVDANSLPRGTNKIAISLDLQGALKDAQNATDPTAQCVFPDNTVHQFACLKVTVTNSGSGSTQSVNCDPLASPKKDLDDQLALGCSPEYTINTGASNCPSTNILESTPQPWSCMELFTGNKTPLVQRGMNRRVFGSINLSPSCTITSCTNPPPCPAYQLPGHNNWAMYDPNAATDGNPNPNTDGFPSGDPRIVGVYLTAYGAFTNTSGTSLTIPVTDFGTFYVTGYSGSPCTTAAGITDHPDDPIPDAGTIVGHFIKYVDRLNTGGGTVPCDPNSFGSCVPVMTK
jgi:Putative Flp pilus-assembly TadE/G-like